MFIRVITARYSEGLQGFPEDAIRQATLGREILKSETYFFMHGDIPHITLVLSLADLTGESTESNRAKNLIESRKKEAGAEKALPPEHRAAYKALKTWRNEKITTKGLSSASVARNPQLLSLIAAAPQTLAAMREVDGITDAFCKTFGAEVLPLLKGLTPIHVESEPSAGDDAQDAKAQDGNVEGAKAGNEAGGAKQG